LKQGALIREKKSDEGRGISGFVFSTLSLGCSAMTNEAIVLPVGTHSVDSEFLSPIEKYRGIVEEAGFDRPEAGEKLLGRSLGLRPNDD
jgi:hypothetical protein